MEYKIGQVFEVKGKWYQFVECDGTCCDNCVFNQGLKCRHPEISMQCARFFRTDGKNGHAVLLDAIGGEYKQGNAIFRDYRCQTKPVTTDKRVYISNSDSEVGLIVSIRLKSLNGIERKMGEVFEYNGEWYQCIVGCYCLDCAFAMIIVKKERELLWEINLLKKKQQGFVLLNLEMMVNLLSSRNLKRLESLSQLEENCVNIIRYSTLIMFVEMFLGTYTIIKQKPY